VRRDGIAFLHFVFEYCIARRFPSLSPVLVVNRSYHNFYEPVVARTNQSMIHQSRLVINQSGHHANSNQTLKPQFNVELTIRKFEV
jgi:hypothetical protein